MTQYKDTQIKKEMQIWVRGSYGVDFYNLAYRLIEDSLMLHGEVTLTTMQALEEAGEPVGYTLPTLEDFKADALEELQAKHSELLRVLTGNYSNEERDTWPIQQEWATKYLGSKDTKSKTLLENMIPADELQELLSTGQDPAEVLATLILNKSASAQVLTSYANKIRRTYDKAVKAAASKTELQQVLARANKEVQLAVERLKDVQ